MGSRKSVLLILLCWQGGGGQRPSFSLASWGLLEGLGAHAGERAHGLLQRRLSAQGTARVERRVTLPTGALPLGCAVSLLSVA